MYKVIGWAIGSNEQSPALITFRFWNLFSYCVRCSSTVKILWKCVHNVIPLSLRRFFSSFSRFQTKRIPTTSQISKLNLNELRDSKIRFCCCSKLLLILLIAVWGIVGGGSGEKRNRTVATIWFFFLKMEEPRQGMMDLSSWVVTFFSWTGIEKMTRNLIRSRRENK